MEQHEGMTNAALMSAANRALGLPPDAGLDASQRNPFPESQASKDAANKPHGYGEVRMPFAPQVAARTSPGVVPMRTP